MITIPLILVILGLVLLFLAAGNISHPRINFGWAGLFCWLLSTLWR